MCIECAIAILIFKEFLYRFFSLMGNDLVLNAAFICKMSMFDKIKDAKIDVEIVYKFHRKIYSSKNKIFFHQIFNGLLIYQMKLQRTIFYYHLSSVFSKRLYRKLHTLVHVSCTNASYSRYPSFLQRSLIVKVHVHVVVNQ